MNQKFQGQGHRNRWGDKKSLFERGGEGMKLK